MLVKLYRDSFETPWGFRLQGGKDLNQALVLQRVFSNSPAEGELQRGDIILSINGRDAGSFTHKQAQDTIKFAGGQIELNVQRPAPGRVHVQPLQPTSPTRAPSNQFYNRRASDITHSKMPAPPIAGHQPKKVTMNKFGGGTTSFGQSFQSKKSTTTWQPVSGQQTSGNMMNRVQDSLDSALSPTSPPQGYYQPPQYQQQQQRQPPPQQQYKPPQQQYHPPPQKQPQQQQQQQYRPPQQQQQQQYQPPPQQYKPPPQPQYQPPPLGQQYQSSSQQQEQYTPTYETVGDLQPDYVRAEDPVLEEDYEYTSVRDRKQQFVETPQQPPHGHIGQNGEVDDDYPHCPVWERRKLFMLKNPRELKRGKKKFVQPVSAGYESFGTDYSKPRTPQEQEQPRFRQPPPPQQPPVNRAPQQQREPEDEGPKPWDGTLKSDGLKPWEIEDRAYIMPSQLEAMQQHKRAPRQQTRQKRQAPAVSPKPKSGAHEINVTPAKPAPVRQISVRSVTNDATEDGPKAVHLQYNSPMGLYSSNNIDQTYQAQIQPEETSSTVSKPGGKQKDGDRDWNQSYVYKMVKEEKKRETQMYPGQAPVTTQTYSSRTYQSGQPTVDESYGISDF